MANTAKLSQALDKCGSSLDTLEKSDSPAPEIIIQVLLARDEVCLALADKKEDSASSVMAVFELDARLQRNAAAIAQTNRLEKWRRSLNPPDEAWWWMLDKLAPGHWADRLDWLWVALAVTLLTAALSFAVDISRRFLTGGPDALSAFAVLAQAVLTLFAAGGALTKAGQEGLSKAFKALRVPSHFHQVAYLPVAMIILGLILLLRSLLPEIAIFYNNRGRDLHERGNLTSAHHDYERAISLSPDYVPAHYNLGLLYEDLLDFEAARQEYQIAVKGGLPAAYNNLARLHILSGDPANAVTLLQPSVLNSVDNPDVRYNMLKNLGWARLLQKRYAQATVVLKEANALNPDKAAANCLLAQVLDAQDEVDAAREKWLVCIAESSSGVPEEDEWIGLGQARLQTGEERQP